MRPVLLALAVLAFGCRSGGREPAPTDAGTAPIAAAADASVRETVSEATDGGPVAELPISIRGTLSFEGELPRLPPLKRTREAACAQMPTAEEWVVVADGKLANVVVRVTEQVRSDAPSPREPVLLRHQGCAYSPRVVALVDGQPLVIENHDGALHNVRVLAGKRVEFNVLHPADANPIRRSFSAGVYTLKCDVHPWAVAYAVVSPHPYLAVTNERGEFEIRGLPPGQYTLETWHERYGPKTATVNVTASGEPARADFSFSEKDRR